MEITNGRVPDTQYQELLKKILAEGKVHHPIHGQKSLRVIGHMMRFKRENGLPATTTRDLMKYKLIHGAIGENIAFMNGARTLDDLEHYGCPRSFWKDWVTKEKCDMFNLREGDLGDGSYGAAWAAFPNENGTKFNQIETMVRLMKERPFLRTILVNPWIPYYTVSGDARNPRKVVVAPCHGWVQVHIDTIEKSFIMTHDQRSADCPVGLQFNMVQYFCMALMLERVTGYRFTELVYTIKDAHIYESQFEHAQKLIDCEPRIYPTVHITDDAPTENIFHFRPHHFVIEEYNPHPWFKIPTPI